MKNLLSRRMSWVVVFLLAFSLAGFSRSNLTPEQKIEWETFYKEYFRPVDLSDVQVTDNPGGFDCVVVIPQGITLAQVVQVYQGYLVINNSTLNDLGKSIVWDDRTPDMGTYAIRIRDRIGDDGELKNCSGNDLAQDSVRATTLLEAFIIELKRYQETGQHPNIRHVTLCDGSRGARDCTPCIIWLDENEPLVFWNNSRNVDSCLYVREVVF